MNLRFSELKQFKTFGTSEGRGLLQHMVHFGNRGKTGVYLFCCRMCFRRLRRALIRSLGGGEEGLWPLKRLFLQIVYLNSRGAQTQ